jgi:hypothetical protein
MERWIKEEAADGFKIVPAILRSGIDEFVALVIPGLQRRKLFRTEYEALRDHLGLPFIPPRFPAKAVK